MRLWPQSLGARTLVPRPRGTHSRTSSFAHTGTPLLDREKTFMYPALIPCVKPCVPLCRDVPPHPTRAFSAPLRANVRGLTVMGCAPTPTPTPTPTGSTPPPSLHQLQSWTNVDYFDFIGGIMGFIDLFLAMAAFLSFFLVVYEVPPLCSRRSAACTRTGGGPASGVGVGGRKVQGGDGGGGGARAPLVAPVFNPVHSRGGV